MSELAFYLIPVFGALIGSVAVLACSWQLRMQLNSLGNIAADDQYIERRIEELIYDRLDSLIHSFKSQIPMVSTLLSQTREEKMRNDARAELIKIVPDILATIPGNLPLERLTNRLWRQMTMPLMLVGAVVGALIGFIEMGVFSLLA